MQWLIIFLLSYMFRSCLIVSSLFSTWVNAQQASEQERISIVGNAPTYLTQQQSVVPLSNLDLFGINQAGSIAEALSLSPQINLNGQGGLFQTFSIRGFSRWRIQTLIEGIPIHSERRAGNAAEFIAPDLLGGAYLLSGAASTQLGSGALGGGIDMQLAASDALTLNVSSNTQQAYRSFSLLGGSNTDNGDLFWAGNIRRAGQGSDANGKRLLNQFENTSGILRWVSPKNTIKDVLLLVSSSQNIGKASSDPLDQRFTEYPKNNHWLAKIDFDWRNARIYAHHADFDTRVVRVEQRTNLLANQALGWGAEISEQLRSDDWQVQWRLALDARTGVKVAEQEQTPMGSLVFDRVNLDGRQFAYSFSANAVRKIDKTEFSAGFRTEYMLQESDIGNVSDSHDVNVSAFFGSAIQWASHWHARIYLSSGYRVPTLTERYFSGSTPRGETLGDPSLETEKAYNIQADLDYVADDLAFNLSVFRQSIDRYIERVSLSPTLLKYVNIGNADIRGASYLASWRIAHGYYAKLQGQLLSGEGDGGNSINDISPDQHSATLGWRGEGHEIWLSATHRGAHKRPGDSEIATGSVNYLRAGFQTDLTASLGLQIQVSNLSDEQYPVSTDDRSPNTMGRNIELNVTYVF